MNDKDIITFLKRTGVPDFMATGKSAYRLAT